MNLTDLAFWWIAEAMSFHNTKWLPAPHNSYVCWILCAQCLKNACWFDAQHVWVMNKTTEKAHTREIKSVEEVKTNGYALRLNKTRDLNRADTKPKLTKNRKEKRKTEKERARARAKESSTVNNTLRQNKRRKITEQQI